MSKGSARYTLMALGLLSSTSIQVDLSASEFAWSEDRWGIRSQVAAIRSEAMAMQEHFPDKSSGILKILDYLQASTCPEEALIFLSTTVDAFKDENTGRAKQLSKYIPAETRQIESVEHKKVPFHRGYHEDLVNDVERLAHQLRHQKNIRNVDTYCESIVPVVGG